MRRIRIIPVLLLKDGGLVKTIRFSNSKYIGDPINTVRIFNDKEVDEIVLLDIEAGIRKKPPDFDKIAEIASECFMPLAYGGGVRNITQVKRILNAGVEKIIFNSALILNPDLIEESSRIYGSQSVVVSIDVKKNPLFKGVHIRTEGASKKQSMSHIAAAKLAVSLGAGEILFNCIDNDGMMAGYNIELIKSVADVVPVPVIACGGAGALTDFVQAVKDGNASAVAAGSMFVFKGPHRAVLANYPSQEALIAQVYNKL